MTIFDTYFHYVRETEPPVIYHRWALISMLGALLGRQCWLPFGPQRIFPNQYIMLIGTPGARKSTAIKLAKKVLAGTGYSTFSAEKTSKEKFLLDMQGDEEDTVTSIFGSSGATRPAREVYVTADEFNEFVGTGNTEFLSLLGALWDWDDEEQGYKQRLKNSKSVEIYQPTISIISGNTHSGFAKAFPVDMLGQGFMSRLVLIYSEPSGKKITIPVTPSAILQQQLTKELLAIKQTVQGPVSWTPDAYSALDTIYKTWPELEDTRFKHYSTRRFTHLLKNCMIVAAARHSTELGVQDVMLANTILSYAELDASKAMGELGRKKGSEANTLIMSVLYEAVEPMTIIDLWKRVNKDVDSLAQLSALLGDLQQADRIQVVRISGSREQGFLPKHQNLGRKNLYVDLNLLKGAEL